MTFDLPTFYSGLSPNEKRQVREQYISKQDNKCCHCGESLDGPPAEHISKKHIFWKSFPPNFLKYPVHLHHSHDTDLTIGAVHAYCNAVLWQYHGE